MTLPTPDLKTRQMQHMLSAFLDAMQRPGLAGSIALTQYGGDDEWTLTIGDTGIGIDTGHPVKLGPSLTGKTTAPGFRTFTMESSAGSRDEPPDAWDCTRCESFSPSTILLSVAELLGRMALDRMPDLPAELCGPEPVLEEVQA